MTIADDLIIANHGAFNPGEPEYRKNYWPSIYRMDNLKFIYEKRADDYRAAIEATENDLKSGKLDDEAKLKAAEFLINPG